MTEAFPLRWPDGWPRTPAARRSPGNQFGKVHTTYRDGHSYKSKGRLTPGVAYDGLIAELQRLGAKNVVVSSNVPTRLDGSMRANAADRRYDDPGVAIYFSLKSRATVMAQDAYLGIAENMRSLSLAIDAMRSLERHGGGTMMTRAFDGFAALPPPAGSKPTRPWWDVLKYSANPEDRELLSAAEIAVQYARKKISPGRRRL